MKTVWIVAGGTGGHLYPGIAVARAIGEGWSVVFVVRRGDLRRSILEKEGFAVIELAGQGLPRGFSVRAAAFPWNFLKGCVEAYFLVKRRRPHRVVGMGGYLSFPALLAARWFGVKTLIHEQNVLPGLANRVLGRWVDSIAVSFPESQSHFRGRPVWTSGLPVRREIGTLSTAEGRKAFGLAEGKVTFLIFGGSQGARRLNRMVTGAWRFLERLDFQVLHIAGERDSPAVQQAYQELAIRSVVVPYCHDMAAAYAAADLVLCRAGASTVAELLAAHRPALLIPYPHASNNHQLFNARVLERKGVGEILPEESLTVESLGRRLSAYLNDPAALRAFQERFRILAPERANQDAAKVLADFITQG